MADAADGLAVVEQAALPPFLETAAKLEIDLTVKGRVSGLLWPEGRMLSWSYISAPLDLSAASMIWLIDLNGLGRYSIPQGQPFACRTCRD